MTTSSARGAAARHRPARPNRPVRPNHNRPHTKPTRTRPVRQHDSIWDELPVQIVSSDNLPDFGELGLPRRIVNALARRGIETPFPIQAATIPDILAGRDLLGRAATGAGKTLAFGLPLLARLDTNGSSSRRPRALILVPTRELAMQVRDSLDPIAAASNLSTCLVAGGLPIGKQIQALNRGVDLVVATPGRLIDLIERRAVDLGWVQTTVLDEADHMADLGFLPVVRQLLDMTPREGQRLLFSATLDGDVATLVRDYLTDPAVYALAAAVASVDTMSHHLYRVPFENKFDLVASIAAREGRTLCFVRTKHGADRLARNLAAAGVAAAALHGGRTQAQRTKALDAFKDGSIPVLVATDVAARGIHVDGVSLVLHVDPPADPKDYLHRSGRTARAGESGTVVLLATPGEERAARGMLVRAGVRAEQRDVAAGDAEVVRTTGARRPSGVPVVAARPKQQHRRPARNGGPRNGGPRRPRRPRS
ncbi:MAG TPA: DEAD/DEAH box helicase [Jatrophihabitans sp.]